jgi:ribonuclease E
MLINATDPEEIRVATLLDGTLLDFDVEFIHNEKIKGNIYKAKVVRADQSLQAAFIHYGGQKNGFLPLGELPRDMVSADGRRGRIQDLLNRDQEILVQAVREEIGTKGAMMTAQVSFPGRYLVLTPGNPVNGISRKIESREEREYFKQLIDELEIPKNMGVIVRTASLGVTKEDFQKDLEYLLDTYKEVLNRYKQRNGPGLVWQEDDVVTRTLRDAFSADMEEVLIDDLETFHAAQNFFKRTMPQFANVLKHYVGTKPLFSKSQTEDQIDRIYARRVGLPSGGALVLDQTEALVAIDVNSGKTSGEGVEDMAFRTNMEAAEEAARQLRLRDLAGLVVIDFIDMKKESHNKAVQDKLVDGLREDKARMEVGKINRFGVLVMTRQRLRPSIQQTTHVPCPHCQGAGQVKSVEALLLSVVRRLKAILSHGDVKELRVKLAPSVALPVLNLKRRELQELEDTYGSTVLILADSEVAYGEMVAEIEKREEEAEDKPAKVYVERAVEPEDETVVLGGDSAISFDKALGDNDSKTPKEPSKRNFPKPAEFKHDRRDVQRAALDERERLRALFESAKPEDEEVIDANSETDGEKEESPTKSGRRRRRGRGGASKGAPAIGGVAGVAPVENAGQDDASSSQEIQSVHVQLTASELSIAKPSGHGKSLKSAQAPPQTQNRVVIEPPVLSGEVVAALLLPTPRPKRLGAAVPTAPAAPVILLPVPAPETMQSAPAAKAPPKTLKAKATKPKTAKSEVLTTPLFAPKAGVKPKKTEPAVGIPSASHARTGVKAEPKPKVPVQKKSKA